MNEWHPEPIMSLSQFFLLIILAIMIFFIIERLRGEKNE